MEVEDRNEDMLDLKLHEPKSAPRNRFQKYEFPEDALRSNSREELSKWDEKIQMRYKSQLQKDIDDKQICFVLTDEFRTFVDNMSEVGECVTNGYVDRRVKAGEEGLRM